MSLVVLRSWTDCPPRIRAIAPPDSDEKDEVVVPDHLGRFVTEEVPKSAPVPPVPVRQVKLRSSSAGVSSASSPSPSPPIPGGKGAEGGPGFLSPFKFWNRGGGRPDKLVLSREPSLQSLQSVGTTESPPLSPQLGSRYKNLGREIAATIPKRLLIRDSWVKDTSPLNRKELSKSSPSLNLSPDEDGSERLPDPDAVPTPAKLRQPKARQLRPASYIDSFYGRDLEPKFGDRPASVVEVFKKEAALQESKEPSGESRKVSFDLDLRSELKLAQTQATSPPINSDLVERENRKNLEGRSEAVDPDLDPGRDPDLDPFRVHRVDHSGAQEEDEIEEELDALRGDSSPSGTNNSSEPGDPVTLDPNMPRGHKSRSPEEAGFLTQAQPQRYHGANTRNGSAWAQVPVQCVNRHVVLPPDRNNEDYIQRQKRSERRKVFCDELLSDVVLRVPPCSPPPDPNHDAIIFFDEEDEDELGTSETESTGLSERENSFEYISVFHNVKVSPEAPAARAQEPPKRLIGLDLGTSRTRYASLAKDSDSGTIHIGESFRSIGTADGLSVGPLSIPHSLSSRSKVIYKWKARQSLPYDPYDLEEASGVLESLLRHYNELLLSGGTIDGAGIQWSLSVHSGMNRQLVREAAFNSGLVGSRDELRLVNDSTAAAVSASKFLRTKKKWGRTFLSANIGSTFIHTSGYEDRPGQLQIIEPSDSQTYESLESNFIELLSRVFTPEFILQYESRFGPAWIEILHRFDEAQELCFRHGSTSNYLFMPISFYVEFQRCTGIQVAECIEDNRHEGIGWDNNGALRLSKDLLEDWAGSGVNFIRTRLKIKNYDAVVLSGGGANGFIQQELARILPAVNVYLIEEPEKAVVEGLVRLDEAHLTFSSPFSIGVGVMTPFDDSVHPEEKCVSRQGKRWCSDVWDCLIRKGQPMTIGQTVLRKSYVGAQPGQSVLVLPIFKSEEEEPKLVTSPTVEKCCEVRFEINREKAWREVQLVIKVQESELSIIATGNDGEVNIVAIDF